MSCHVAPLKAMAPKTARSSLIASSISSALGSSGSAGRGLAFFCGDAPILYAFLTLSASHMPAKVSSWKGSGVPWMEEPRCVSIASLLAMAVDIV